MNVRGGEGHKHSVMTLPYGVISPRMEKALEAANPAWWEAGEEEMR